MNSSFIKISIVVFGAIFLALAIVYDVHKLINLEKIQSISESLSVMIDANPIKSFFIAFVMMTLIYCLPLPIAALLSLTAGFLFNFSVGLLLVLSSALVAASITFLVSRFLARDWIAEKFATYMQIVDQEIATHGFLYALGIRLVPGIPFIALNATLGITKLPLPAFYISTILGMIPISAILVNAGKQLNSISSINDVLTPNILLSLLLLACFPFVIRLGKSLLMKNK